MKTSTAPRGKHRPGAHGPDRDDVHGWLGFALNQVADRVAARTAAALAGLGLKPRAFGVLISIRAAPGASQLALARSHALDRTTMSQLIDDLARDGWIERREHADDRRVNTLALTLSGGKRLAKAKAEAARAEDEVLQALSPDQRLALRELLVAVLQADRE